MKHPFLTGAVAYPLLEIAWRRRTHPAMALAGGTAMQMLCVLARMQKGRPLWRSALWGGLMITGMEYLFGVTFNRRYHIWDYRRTPFNYRGQICLPYTLGWCLLSAAVLSVLQRGQSSRDRMSTMRRLA